MYIVSAKLGGGAITLLFAIYNYRKMITIAMIANMALVMNIASEILKDNLCIYGLFEEKILTIMTIISSGHAALKILCIVDFKHPSSFPATVQS